MKRYSQFLHILSFIFLIAIVGLNAQQPISPLMTSFKEYQQMKSNTEFGVDWIQLGPTINSARADAIQVDPTHPGTMYVAFGSGNLLFSTVFLHFPKNQS